MVEESIAIKIFTWIINNFSKNIITNATKSLWVTFKRNGIKKSANDYIKSIKFQYGSMQIFGMSEPIPLEEIFTTVNIIDGSVHNKEKIHQVFQDYHSVLGPSSNLPNEIQSLDYLPQKLNPIY